MYSRSVCSTVRLKCQWFVLYTVAEHEIEWMSMGLSLKLKYCSYQQGKSLEPSTKNYTQFDTSIVWKMPFFNTLEQLKVPKWKYNEVENDHVCELAAVFVHLFRHCMSQTRRPRGCKGGYMSVIYYGREDLRFSGLWLRVFLLFSIITLTVRSRAQDHFRSADLIGDASWRRLTVSCKLQSLKSGATNTILTNYPLINLTWWTDCIVVLL